MTTCRSRRASSSATAGSAAGTLFCATPKAIYIHQGRSDELIKIAGQWVQPARARGGRGPANARFPKPPACRCRTTTGWSGWRSSSPRSGDPAAAQRAALRSVRARAAAPQAAEMGARGEASCRAPRPARCSASSCAKSWSASFPPRTKIPLPLVEALHGSRHSALDRAGAAGRWFFRQLPGAAHLLRRTQLRRAPEGDGRRRPRAAVLLPEERVRAWCPSGGTIHYPAKTSNYHYETELVVAIAKGGRRIDAQARQRPRLRLRRRPRHDAARPAAVGQGPRPAVGLRQELRRVGALQRARAGGEDRSPVEGRDLAQRQRQAAPEGRPRPT